MHRMIKTALLLVIGSGLAGCVTTSEMPLAKNVWQVSTESQGTLFVGQADKSTMKRAAELTIAQGYDHFIVQNPQTQTGAVQVGNMPVTANTSVNVIGNTAYGTTTYTGGGAIMAPQKNVSVTVVMFHANEPQAAQAVDAAAYLKQLNS
jgi:hypothetical protein